MAEWTTKTELYRQRAAELEAIAQSATNSGKATFKQLAERYRRLAVQSSARSLATATDAEIESLVSRMVDHRLLKK